MPKGKLLDPNRKMRVMQKRSRKQEDDIAEDIGGRRHPGSGNQWHSKHDVSNKKILVEAKVTSREQYTLKLRELNELVINAVAEGKDPVLEISFGTDLTVCVVPLSVAKRAGIR